MVKSRECSSGSLDLRIVVIRNVEHWAWPTVGSGREGMGWSKVGGQVLSMAVRWKRRPADCVSQLAISRMMGEFEGAMMKG